MIESPWPQLPPPEVGSRTSTLWAAPADLADLTMLRRRLLATLADGLTPACGTHDDVERLLLTFEELASNALRHGLPPARVAITMTSTGWLLDVSDAAAERPPTPAVGRDPANGGLGLRLVARLCADHGWLVQDGRKHVWAQLVCEPDPPRTGEGRSAEDDN